MKTFIKTFAFFVIMIVGTWLNPQQVSAQNGPISLQVFYDELSPYGEWVDNPTYGYVWVPDVDQDFVPYVTNGHWVFTDYGWTWVSDFSWGWAPFHYGRWTTDPQYGYIWIPDTEWGPAWVTWRQANGYIGWAPMGPGISIDIALGRSYFVPRERWCFVRNRDFMQYDLFNYRLNRALSFNIFNMSLIIRNTRYDNDRHFTYFYGPQRDMVQRFASRPIVPVRIRDYDRPGQSFNQNYLNIYRPQLKRGSVNGVMPTPRNVNRDNANQNRNSSFQGRSNQNVQPQGANAPQNQREIQNSRFGNPSNNQGRNNQNVQQPNTNPSGNQREVQYNRYGNPYNSGRFQQPSRSGNVNNPVRTQPQVQQPATNQPKAQPVQPSAQNGRPAENAKRQPNANRRQERAKMVVNPEQNKREEANQPSR